jgi:hypothetical protein
LDQIDIIPIAIDDRQTLIIDRQRDLKKPYSTHLSAQKMTTCDGSCFIKITPLDEVIWNLI